MTLCYLYIHQYTPHQCLAENTILLKRHYDHILVSIRFPKLINKTPEFIPVKVGLISKLCISKRLFAIHVKKSKHRTKEE